MRSGAWRSGLWERCVRWRVCSGWILGGWGRRPAEERGQAEAVAAEQRLAPDAGVMLQAVWFDLGKKEPGQVLLVLHHLVVDGVSWRILLPDFKAALAAVASGQQPALVPCGTSFGQWARLLETESRSEKEKRNWRSGKAWIHRQRALSGDLLDTKRDTRGKPGTCA